MYVSNRVSLRVALLGMLVEANTLDLNIRKPLIDRSLEASRYECAHCDFWAIASNLVYEAG